MFRCVNPNSSAIAEVILIAVRWYLRYGLSYRDLEELLAERGIEVDHVTLFRWLQRFTPILVDSAEPCRHGVALHKPGVEPGQNAVRALRSIHDRRHPARFLAADRAYTNAKPEDFQLPARALGYSPVLDYKIDQLGHQGSFGGMLLVDGAWYCPSIPHVFITCTYDHRKWLIDNDTYHARLDERRNYVILTKDSPDESGQRRMRWPASNPNPVARCELKPGSKKPSTRGRITIPVIDAMRGSPPKICLQQSITVAGAKYRQELLHESPESHATYGPLRNAVEGMNGYLKDGAHQALDDPERRRIRGVAAQSVLVAFQIFGAILRKIDMFVAREVAEEARVVRHLPSRRLTGSLSDWKPVPSSIESAGPSGSGPDPPLIA